MLKETRGKATTHDGDIVSYVYYPAETKNPALIMHNGVGCIETYYVPLIKHLRGRYPMITWDYRGHGKSPLPADLESVSVENHARDAASVMDAIGVEKAVHLGFSMGVQVGFEFFRWFPERTLALVAICGPYGKPYDVFFKSALLAKGLDKMFDAALAGHKVVAPILRFFAKSPLAFDVAKLVEIDPRTKREDMQSYFDHMAVIDVPLAIHALKKMNEHTAEDVLPTINVPTLIIAGAKDSATPLRHQYDMHRLIPGSELTILPYGSHAGPIEHPLVVNYRIEVFLRDHFEYDASGESEDVEDEVA